MEARYLTDLEWRICHAVNIYVFRNGRDGEQPVLVHIPPAKKKNMKTVMNVIQDRVKYPVGYAKYLYKMDGTRVKDPCELEMYNNYVVASNFEKHFKCAAYGRRRSPLLVLNRESKHVRVLKLQNQNYYEWLLKKKAVGEERPAYIYPPYYTSENRLPQDLPVGKMGNYNPGEIHAPGCCYPTTEGGRTYRVDSSQNKYVVNALTVDVTPDFRNLPLPDFRDKRKSKHGQNGYPLSNKYGGKNGRKLEPTPSDMVNANVLVVSDVTSQEMVTVTATSVETDDHRRQSRKQKESISKVKPQKAKGQRVHMVSSEEYHHRPKQHYERSAMPVTESSTVSTQSSQEVMKKPPKQHPHHHSHHQQVPQNKRSTSKTRQVKSKRKVMEAQPQVLPVQYSELGPPPPPPAQFRDTTADLNNNKNMTPATAATMRLLPPPTQFRADTQEILNYVDRAVHDPNANVPLAPQKSFYYSPEKLAEINAAGNLQPIELSYATNSLPQQQRTLQQVAQQPNAAPSLHPPQWALVHNPNQPGQQQLLQPMYAIESQPGGPGTPTTTTLIPAQSMDPTGMLGTYAVMPQQNQAQLMQGLALPQGPLSQAGAMLPPPLPSQQAVFQNGTTNGATQCIVFPNNCMSPPPPPGTQLIALPSTSSQSHLQQVYQLGIVQQPNPQTCIQVDAKAMRQYVDNQKLIECRFQQQQLQQGSANEDKSTGKYSHRRKSQRQQQQQRKVCSDVTDVTETEVDIPFTPLKTYRLENPPNVTQSHSSVGQNERSQNPSRYRHERLPKVKSRNVAIQMGYPASARSSRALNDYLESIRNLPGRPSGGGVGGGGGELSHHTSDLSFNFSNNNRSRSDSMANAVNLGASFSSLLRTPKPDRERFFLQNSASTSSGRALRRSSQFGSSFSDQYLGLHSGRNLAQQNVLDPVPSSQANNNAHATSSNPYSGRSARRRLSTDPVLEELITIPPPTEFRGYPLHSNRQRDHQLDHASIGPSSDYNVQRILNNNPSDHSMYPYTNNDRSQYMYSRYP